MAFKQSERKKKHAKTGLEKYESETISAEPAEASRSPRPSPLRKFLNLPAQYAKARRSQTQFNDGELRLRAASSKCTSLLWQAMPRRRISSTPKYLRRSKGMVKDV